MKRRPLILPACATIALLPGLWLAFRLVADRAGMEQMCLAATWYDPARCAASAMLLRGMLSVGVAGFLAASTLWLLARKRCVVAASEEALMSSIRGELRSIPASHRIAIVVMSLIALAIRVPLLSMRMRSDENQTLLIYTSRSLEAALWQFDTTNNHILFSVLSRIPVAVFGDAPWSARLIELIAGVLLIPATALALRGVRGVVPALLGAALVAGLPYLAAISSNARGYSLVALLFLFAVPLAIRLSARVDLVGWTLFSTLSALALLTNPTALYPFGALGVWVFARRVTDSRRMVADVLGGGVLIGLLSWAMYGPALTAMGTQALFANPWMTPPSWNEFASSFAITLDGTARELWWQWGWGLPAWVMALIVVAMAIALATDSRKDSRARGMLIAMVFWTAVVAIASHRLPYTRVLMPYLPLLLVAAAGAIITILQRIGLPTLVDSRLPAVGAVVLALALSLTHGAARTVHMTRARAATAHESLVSSSHACSCLIGDWPFAHGARAHARSRTARGHAEHA